MEQEAVELVRQLSDAFKNIAPEVWAIMLRQQYVEAATALIWPVLAAVAWWWFGVETMRKVDGEIGRGIVSQDFDTLFGGTIVLVVLALFTLFATVTLVECLRHLINPEYYAIEELMSQIR